MTRPAIIAALALALAAPGARARARTEQPDHLVVRQTAVMGTVVNVSIWTDDDERAARAIGKVFAEFERIDALMTSWKETGDVAAINAAAGGKPVTVSDEVLGVITRSLEYARLTRGAFDITVGTYKGLWKFGGDQDGSIPSEADVAARLPLVGWRRVKVDGKRKTVRLAKAGTMITLGGIAKGYAVDRAVAILRDEGFVDFIIQAGGDLYAGGRRGDRKWRVGIRDPRGDRDTPFALAEIEDMTFSTSGDYERGFVADGVRYHHILDPRTGHPARACRSVTVMAPDALTADALSTALFVLGPKKGLALVERLPRVEAVFVDASNQVTASSGLKLVRERPADLTGVVWVMRDPTDGV